MALSLAGRGVVWNLIAGSTGEAAKDTVGSMGSAMPATPAHSSPVLHVLPVLRAVARSLQQSVAASSMPSSVPSAALSDVMSCDGQGCGKAFSFALAGKANVRLSSRVSILRMV